jgi:hypothetical protein
MSYVTTISITTLLSLEFVPPIRIPMKLETGLMSMFCPPIVRAFSAIRDGSGFRVGTRFSTMKRERM